MDGGTDPGLVIVSIGGNDVGFSKIGDRVSGAWKLRGAREAVAGIAYARSRAAIDGTYKAIRRGRG